MASSTIYTLSLHDALPISGDLVVAGRALGYQVEKLGPFTRVTAPAQFARNPVVLGRSEEHTSELQSHSDLVCRLLLEKKNPDRRQAEGAPGSQGDRRARSG